MKGEQTELVQLERGFWEAGAGGGAYYREHCVPEARFVFFFGAIDLEQCVEAIDGNTVPWASYEFANVATVELDGDNVALVYRATARREGDASDTVVMVSSVYTWRDGAWKMALHQQTPAAG